MASGSVEIVTVLGLVWLHFLRASVLHDASTIIDARIQGQNGPHWPVKGAPLFRKTLGHGIEL